VVSNYEYDGLGQRTSQTVGGVTTEYVLDTSAGLSASVAGGPSTALRTGLPEVIVATSGGASTYYVQVEGQILVRQNPSFPAACPRPDSMCCARWPKLRPPDTRCD
jgi:hypothetical protein